MPKTPIAGLRVRYQELFFGPTRPRRLVRICSGASVAHRIQEKVYGGLSRPIQRLLDRLITEYAAKPGGKIVLPRRIKPGSVLVRQWKGKSHRVVVLAEGFAYDGRTFGNLSEIAVLITGTRWNGPRFFGLRSKTAEADPPALSGGSGKATETNRDVPRRSSHLGGGSDYRKRNAAIAAKSAREEGPTWPLAPSKSVRCAIYTRKSTEHGLGAGVQLARCLSRDACEAYIKSQASQGWRALPQHYDDPRLPPAAILTGLPFNNS